MNAWLMDRLRQKLSDLPRPAKVAVMVAGDVVLVPVALWLAFALKYDSLNYGFERDPWMYAGAIVASIAIFAWLQLYRAVVRYIGPKAIAAIIAGSVGSALVVYMLGRTLAWSEVPASVAVIYAMLALFWIAGSRFSARRVLLPGRPVGELVVIYGAGDAGVRLLRSLGSGSGSRRQPSSTTRRCFRAE